MVVSLKIVLDDTPPSLLYIDKDKVGHVSQQRPLSTPIHTATLFVKKKVVFVHSRRYEDYRMESGNIVLQLGL
jgi:hypothetical protein